MSELAVIGTIFHVIQTEKKLNRQRLLEILATRKIDNQFESPELIESLVEPLVKMYVISGNFDSNGDFSLETFVENSGIFQLIIKLRNFLVVSRNVDDFKELVLGSELNRFFIDENEMKRVYLFLKNEMLRGSFDY
ncbi:MAG TPA: hypothetical protein VKM55_22925 [Candidatus Lokiarchaeia archaeon]|nr:hypothetical protein [Candidatus Lokiarchaeia archaeon]